MRLVAPRIAGAVLVYLVVQHGTAARVEEYKWWRDPAVQQELTLTAEQVRSLEMLFASTQAKQRKLGKDLNRLERGVEQAIAEAEIDEIGLRQAVDDLEAMRARRNATRTLMLVRMYRTLSPEQRQRLRAMQKVGERARRRGTPASPSESPSGRCGGCCTPPRC